MAVKIRMTRMGRRHRPFFRINAIDSRAPRDGKILEKLGHYDPIEKDDTKQLVLNHERVKYWLDNGAIPSDTVSQILVKEGIEHKYAKDRAAKQAKARAIARQKGKPFNEYERKAEERAAAAEAARLKAEADAKAKAEAEAKAKAEAEAEAKAKEEAEAKAKAPEEPAAAEENKEEAGE